jgi:hypothetical protein
VTLATALLAASACVPIAPDSEWGHEPETFYGTVQSGSGLGVARRSIDCSTRETAIATCKGDAGCSLMCGKILAERSESEAIEKQQAESKPDQLCQLWAAMEGGDQYQFIEDSHHAWADAYDLSPEMRWCMTNERSVKTQANAVDAACKSGSRINAESIIESAQRKCGAFPPPEN